MRKHIYICDGLACNNEENCYIRGGECTHTSNEDHSIKKQLGDDFPPTTFVEAGDGKVIVEEIKETMRKLNFEVF